MNRPSGCITVVGEKMSGISRRFICQCRECRETPLQSISIILSSKNETEIHWRARRQGWLVDRTTEFCVAPTSLHKAAEASIQLVEERPVSMRVITKNKKGRLLSGLYI